MVDNKQNNTENQSQNPQPLYESVSVEDQSIKPEEIAPDVDSPSAEKVTQASQDNSGDAPPLVYEENRYKFLLIGGSVVLIFLIIVVMSVIFGGKSKPKEVNLTYWGLWEEKEVFAPLIELYRQKNPHVKIDYQKMSPQDYKSKLLVRSENNQGPDMFRFHNTWLPQLKKIVSPLPSNIMSNSEFEKTFYKIHQKDLKNDKYYYGLPLMIDGLVLVYNESLFKKAGIETPPATWEDLISIVPKLTVKEKAGTLITSGIALGTTSNVEHFSDSFGLMLVLNGGSLKQLDKPEAKGALESYRRFAEQEFWTDAMPNSITAFIQEKVAMLIVPSWELMTIKGANPDIKLKVVPIPPLPGVQPVTLATYWAEGVSRYSKNQTEAWKFLRFLTEKENMTKLYELESKIRLFGEPYSRVDLAPLLVQNPYIGAVVKQADYYVSLPLISKTYDEGLNNDIIKYLENAINATSQGVSYEEALKTAKQGIDQVFTKYKIE